LAGRLCCTIYRHLGVFVAHSLQWRTGERSLCSEQDRFRGARQLAFKAFLLGCAPPFAPVNAFACPAGTGAGAEGFLQKAADVANSLGMTPPTEPSKKQKADYDKMSKMSGAQFDKAFAAHMVADHKKDIKEYERASRSPVTMRPACSTLGVAWALFSLALWPSAAEHLSTSECTFLGFVVGTVYSHMGWARQECTASLENNGCCPYLL
jgi:Domain of unknown function (DUF4142)